MKNRYLYATFFIFTFSFALFTQNQPVPKHKIISDKIIEDDQIKVQVQVKAVLLDKVTKENVSALLNSLYQMCLKKKGFRYYSAPVVIEIKVYLSEEKASDKVDMDVGWLLKTASLEPQIVIDDEAIKNYYAPKIARFGFSDNIRQKIYNEIMDSEGKANDEANENYEYGSQANKELYNKLKKKYRINLARKYKTSVAIMDSIWLEGMTKHW